MITEEPKTTNLFLYTSMKYSIFHDGITTLNMEGI